MKVSFDEGSRIFEPENLMALRVEPAEQTYGGLETVLYALGVGVGMAPISTEQWKFVNPDQPTALPTMAASCSSAWNASAG